MYKYVSIFYFVINENSIKDAFVIGRKLNNEDEKNVTLKPSNGPTVIAFDGEFRGSLRTVLSKQIIFIAALRVYGK